MQKKILVLAFLLYSLAGSSQQDTSLLITPGVGIGPLKLGMNETEALKILNGKITWIGYKEELKTYYKEYPRIDSLVQFVMGFDSCGYFFRGGSPESMPVFCIFFKDHQLNYIGISYFGASEKHIRETHLSNGLKFLYSMTTCVNRLGPDYLPIEYNEYSGDHYYYKMGLEVLYSEGELTMMGVFPPLPEFKAMIAAKSATLLKQAEALQK